MLASYKTDKASLDRAWVIARRLRGTNEPAFADTYGWVAQLRGNTDEAVPYLEAAAKALTTDPMVQFHLAEAYKAAGRAEDAKAQYAKVLALVAAGDSRAFVQTARKETGAAPASTGTGGSN
jgi:predicted Zn-dependent protease